MPCQCQNIAPIWSGAHEWQMTVSIAPYLPPLSSPSSPLFRRRTDPHAPLLNHTLTAPHSLTYPCETRKVPPADSPACNPLDSSPNLASYDRNLQWNNLRRHHPLHPPTYLIATITQPSRTELMNEETRQFHRERKNHLTQGRERERARKASMISSSSIDPPTQRTVRQYYSVDIITTVISQSHMSLENGSERSCIVTRCHITGDASHEMTRTEMPMSALMPAETEKWIRCEVSKCDCCTELDVGVLHMHT